MQKLLIVHGGGPTAVMNATLFGVLDSAVGSEQFDQVWGARYGVEGILQQKFIRLDVLDTLRHNILVDTPGSALGTTRYPLHEIDFLTMRRILVDKGFTHVLFNGGNGTMDVCYRMHECCNEFGISVVGIPKTVDNDLMALECSPGFLSAANYLIESIKELSYDVRSTKNHVVIVETMGRNAGWLTACSALARSGKQHMPDLIYLPELPLRVDSFLTDVQEAYKLRSSLLIVVSEGLKGSDGAPLVPPASVQQRSVSFGCVAEYLSNLVRQNLGIKSRFEKPGILGRCSIAWQTKKDRELAITAGRQGVQALLDGKSGVMISGTQADAIEINQVVLTEKTVPLSMIAENGHDVTKVFYQWAENIIFVEDDKRSIL